MLNGFVVKDVAAKAAEVANRVPFQEKGNGLMTLRGRNVSTTARHLTVIVLVEV
jgi:hypothetical protein